MIQAHNHVSVEYSPSLFSSRESPHPSSMCARRTGTDKLGNFGRRGTLGFVFLWRCDTWALSEQCRGM